MIRLFLFAALFAVALADGSGSAAAACKEQCVKHCMGNDTPTERAECLKRDKCDLEPACPTGGIGSTTGTTFDPGSPPPKPGGRLPKVYQSVILHAQ